MLESAQAGTCGLPVSNNRHDALNRKLFHIRIHDLPRKLYTSPSPVSSFPVNGELDDLEAYSVGIMSHLDQQNKSQQHLLDSFRKADGKVLPD